MLLMASIDSAGEAHFVEFENGKFVCLGSIAEEELLFQNEIGTDGVFVWGVDERLEVDFVDFANGYLADSHWHSRSRRRGRHDADFC